MSLSVFLVLYLAFFLVMEHLLYIDVVCRTSMEQLLDLGSRPKRKEQSRGVKLLYAFKIRPFVWHVSHIPASTRHLRRSFLYSTEMLDLIC